jgi:hypothetical protein
VSRDSGQKRNPTWDAAASPVWQAHAPQGTAMSNPIFSSVRVVLNRDTNSAPDSPVETLQKFQEMVSRAKKGGTLAGRVE